MVGWRVVGWRVVGWARIRLQNGGRPRLDSRDEISGLCWHLSGLYVAKSIEKMSGLHYQAVHQ